MPDFKVRRKALFLGGIAASGASILGDVANNINFTGTASFSGPIAAGSAGATFNDILYGSGCINCPSCVGGGSIVVVGTGSLTTNFAAGDKIFLMPYASMVGGMVLVGACCVTGCVSASWINTASADNSASANVAVNYLIFS